MSRENVAEAVHASTPEIKNQELMCVVWATHTSLRASVLDR